MTVFRPSWNFLSNLVHNSLDYFSFMQNSANVDHFEPFSVLRPKILCRKILYTRNINIITQFQLWKRMKIGNIVNNL